MIIDDDSDGGSFDGFEAFGAPDDGDWTDSWKAGKTYRDGSPEHNWCNQNFPWTGGKDNDADRDHIRCIVSTLYHHIGPVSVPEPLAAPNTIVGKARRGFITQAGAAAAKLAVDKAKEAAQKATGGSTSPSSPSTGGSADVPPSFAVTGGKTALILGLGAAAFLFLRRK